MSYLSICLTCYVFHWPYDCQTERILSFRPVSKTFSQIYLCTVALLLIAGCETNTNDPASEYLRCPDIAVLYDASKAVLHEGHWEIGVEQERYEQAGVRLFLGAASAKCSYSVNLSQQQVEIGEVVGAGVVAAPGLLKAEISIPVGVDWLDSSMATHNLPDFKYFVILLDPEGEILDKKVYYSHTQAAQHSGKTLIGHEDITLDISLVERLHGQDFQVFIGLQP